MDRKPSDISFDANVVLDAFRSPGQALDASRHQGMSSPDPLAVLVHALPCKLFTASRPLFAHLRRHPSLLPPPTYSIQYITLLSNNIDSLSFQTSTRVCSDTYTTSATPLRLLITETIEYRIPAHTLPSDYHCGSSANCHYATASAVMRHPHGASYATTAFTPETAFLRAI